MLPIEYDQVCGLEYVVGYASVHALSSGVRLTACQVATCYNAHITGYQLS